MPSANAKVKKKRKEVKECSAEEVVICKCPFKCKTISIERISSMRRKFKNLDYTAKSNYLISRLTLGNIKCCREENRTDPKGSRRQCTIHYSIPSDTDLIDVCKKTFMRLFTISNGRLQRLIELVKKGEVSFSSNAGKNENSHKHKVVYTEEMRNSVILHIMKFPREEAHYSRSKTTKEYLSPDLNIARMYHMYKLENLGTIMKEKKYREIFHEYFSDLRFHRPRTDTCVTCDKFRLQIKLDPSNSELVAQFDSHVKEADTAKARMYRHMKASREPESNTFVASMDLEKVLFVPTLTHSQMFYSRQLSVYNLCIHPGETKNAFMNIWHEGIAGRGSNEIGSCFIKLFMTKNLTTKKEIEVWCDNCAGQNKNQMLVFAMMYLVRIRLYESIEFHFLVSRHSFMPCDQDFSVIEKRKRKCQAMIPDEIKNVIKTAELERPFNIIDIEENDILDLKTIAHSVLNTNKMKISSVTGIKVTLSKLIKNCVGVKNTYLDSEEWEDVNVAKKGVSLIEQIPEVLPKCTEKVTIKQKKLDDLEKMVELLDPKYRDFYAALAKKCKPVENQPIPSTSAKTAQVINSKQKVEKKLVPVKRSENLIVEDIPAKRTRSQRCGKSAKK